MYYMNYLESKTLTFFLITFVRMFYLNLLDDEMVEEVMTVVREIPLWINKGDATRVFWSENHIIMFLSSRLLLNELFPQESFLPFDNTFREKLIWWLETKVEHGFYEINSHYYRFTISALLNLFDFADEDLIRDLAKQCLDILFNGYAKCMNTKGYCNVATSRGIPRMYTPYRMYTRFEHLVGHIAFGTDLVNNFEITNTADNFLLTTNYRPYEAYLSWALVDEYEIRFGHDYREKNLIDQILEDRDDRIVGGMSMGGYAHKDYIGETLNLIDRKNLWQHPLFSSFSVLEHIPRSFFTALGQFGESVTSGSLLVGTARVWKNNDVALSTLETDFEGKKGYEQITYVSSMEDLACIMTATDKPIQENIEDFVQTNMNHQMPKIIQEDNIALLQYNPSRDLYLLFSGRLDVLLFCPFQYFNEVIVFDDWFVLVKNDNYIAINTNCGTNIDKKEEFMVCTKDMQSWITIVGNAEVYSNKTNFVNLIKESDLTVERRRNCIETYFEFDGKAYESVMCKEFGNFFLAIFILTICLLSCITCCCVCVHRKCRSSSFERKIKEDDVYDKDNDDISL